MNKFKDQAPEFEKLELRILHGPQAGARMVLVAGRDYIMGTGETCAVVLAGAQVEEEHAMLSVDAAGIRVTPLQGDVDTSPGEFEPGVILALGTVLTMGRVKLTVELSKAAWPSDESMERAGRRHSTSPTEAPAPAQASSAGGQPESAAGQQEPPPRRTAKLIQLIRQKPVDAAVAGGGLLCAILTAGVLAAMSLSQDPGPAAPTGEVAAAAPQEQAAPAVAETKDASDGAGDALAQLLKTVPHATLKTSRTETGTWVISGLVADERDRQMLRDGAAQLGIPVEMRLVDETQRLAAVGKFLDARRSSSGLALRAERGEGNTLRIAGAAKSPQEAAAFEEVARRELADMEPLQFALLQPVDVRAQFMQRLRAAGLQDRFTVLRAEPELELKAVLTRQEIRAWEAMFSEFAGIYGSVVRVTATVEAEGDNLIASIAAVVGGAYPFIMTTSGERIAPGGTLGGRTVVAVRDAEIVLAGGMRLRYGP